MRKQSTGVRNTDETAISSTLTMEVHICQARQECWQYSWDRNQAQFYLSGVHQGQADLPVDLATLRLERQAEVPVYVLAAHSIAPGTRVSVRVLGALQAPLALEGETDPFPLAGWILLAVPDFPGIVPRDELLESLPAAQLSTLRAHACAQVLTTSTSNNPGEIVLRTAAEVAHHLREARFWLKRLKRQQAQTQRKTARRDEEPAVAWRAVEALTTEQRAQIAQARTREELVSLLQVEQLIRFVPARFQRALEQVLLEDERLLAFLERPLLRHRSGWLGLQQYRANAGLLLVTDRQVLWVRDFFSPGSSVFPEGYIARSVPLARLTGVHCLPAETVPTQPENHSRYRHLLLEMESSRGCEGLEIAFPNDEVSETALARIVPILQAFLPCVNVRDQQDRRVRCLPVVETWMPQGEEARRLSGLGGGMSADLKQRLEQQLAETLQASGEELLASALIPALEEYRSPARLVALTRAAVLLFEAPVEQARGLWKTTQDYALPPQRYELAQLSSVQLSYSLLGASLRLYLPQLQGTTQELVIPFHSPALAWFLPLFTRLRLALGSPLPLAQFPSPR